MRIRKTGAEGTQTEVGVERKNWKLRVRRGIQAPQQGPTCCQSFQEPQSLASATLTAQMGKLSLREVTEATGQRQGWG